MIIINDIVYLYKKQQTKYDIEINLDNETYFVSSKNNRHKIKTLYKIIIDDPHLIWYDGDHLCFFNTLYNEKMIHFYETLLLYTNNFDIYNCILFTKNEILNSNDINLFKFKLHSELDYIFTIINQQLIKLAKDMPIRKPNKKDLYLMMNCIFFRWLNAFKF